MALTGRLCTLAEAFFCRLTTLCQASSRRIGHSAAHKCCAAHNMREPRKYLIRLPYAESGSVLLAAQMHFFQHVWRLVIVKCL